MAQCAWKLPDTWEQMKQAVGTLEHACPPDLTWKVHLYKGYLAIRRYQEPTDSTFDLSVIEKHAKCASTEAIQAWRRLPHIVSVRQSCNINCEKSQLCSKSQFSQKYKILHL